MYVPQLRAGLHLRLYFIRSLPSFCVISSFGRGLDAGLVWVQQQGGAVMLTHVMVGRSSVDIKLRSKVQLGRLCNPLGPAMEPDTTHHRFLCPLVSRGSFTVLSDFEVIINLRGRFPMGLAVDEFVSKFIFFSSGLRLRPTRGSRPRSPSPSRRSFSLTLKPS